jgi:hypothetical protein
MEKFEFKVNGKVTVEQYEDRIVMLIDEEKPKHKEPIIGELAIFWDIDKEWALVGIYSGWSDEQNGHDSNVGFIWDNAILFESIEQYKEFVKG